MSQEIIPSKKHFSQREIKYQLPVRIEKIIIQNKNAATIEILVENAGKEIVFLKKNHLILPNERNDEKAKNRQRIFLVVDFDKMARDRRWHKFIIKATSYEDSVDFGCFFMQDGMNSKYHYIP